MKRTLSALLVMIYFCSISFAQDAASERNRKALADAAKNGNGLTTQITVNGNVHAQAVLIPKVDARRIFGNEIANNYAVVEINVGNKSPDAALIIHGVFIDYRDWPLSGAPSGDISSMRSPDPYQASTFPSQVASEEYRIVRGQLLDAQTDTWRNRFLRWLTLAGNLAGAFTFSLNEQGIVKGIAAATGVGIPGVATAWPDKTIDQLNRVSDFGFRSNKLIPKQGSDVIVCFFPIDRFLTPGFRKLFLKSPALFFAPLQMLVDKKAEAEAKAALGDIFQGLGFNFENLKDSLPCYMKIRHSNRNAAGYDICLDHFGLEFKKDPKTDQEIEPRVLVVKKGVTGNIANADRFKWFMGLEFVGSVSLNRVTVTVDGVMSVDVNTIAARIDEVNFDTVADCGDADGQCFWRNAAANGGVRTGVIRGAFLSGGKVVLAEQTALGIEDLKVITEGSNDNELQFSFKLTKPVSNQTKLHFTVEKEDSGSDAAKPKKLESNTWESLVAYSPSAVAISSVTFVDPTLTVKGSGFISPAAAAGASPMIVTLHSKARAGAPVAVPAAAITFTSPSEFSINLSTLNLTARCWYVQVEVDRLTSNRSDNFLPVLPAPTLDYAKHNGKFIYLKGKDLVNLSDCDGPKIGFRLTQTGAASIPLTVEDWSNGEPVLVMPEAAKTGAWKVEVLIDGGPVTSGAVTADLTAQQTP
jgi:hypothetical protein